MKREVKIKPHGIDTTFQVTPSCLDGVILLMTSGLTTISMWISADDMRAIALAMTQAADEAQMKPEIEA